MAPIQYSLDPYQVYCCIKKVHTGSSNTVVLDRPDLPGTSSNGAAHALRQMFMLASKSIWRDMSNLAPAGLIMSYESGREGRSCAVQIVPFHYIARRSLSSSQLAKSVAAVE